MGAVPRDTRLYLRVQVRQYSWESLAQIEEKGYFRPYEADGRKLFKVETVFSSEMGTISDWTVMD